MPDQGEQAPPSAMPADGRNGEWSGPDGSGGQGSADADASGGAPQADAAGGGAGMGDASCVIEITGGYYVLESGGDTLDSNGSIALGGGVVLAQSAMGTSDFALDYDIEATVDGGVLIALGGTGMAQSLTSGSQAFAMANVEGSAGGRPYRSPMRTTRCLHRLRRSAISRRLSSALPGWSREARIASWSATPFRVRTKTGTRRKAFLRRVAQPRLPHRARPKAASRARHRTGQQAAARMPGDTSVG